MAAKLHQFDDITLLVNPYQQKVAVDVALQTSFIWFSKVTESMLKEQDSHWENAILD